MEQLKKYELLEEEKDVFIVCEPQNNWGGMWTEEKLDAFEKYVKAYLTIMKKYATEKNFSYEEEGVFVSARIRKIYLPHFKDFLSKADERNA